MRFLTPSQIGFVLAGLALGCFATASLSPGDDKEFKEQQEQRSKELFKKLERWKVEWTTNSPRVVILANVPGEKNDQGSKTRTLLIGSFRGEKDGKEFFSVAACEFDGKVSLERLVKDPKLVASTVGRMRVCAPENFEKILAEFEKALRDEK